MERKNKPTIVTVVEPEKLLWRKIGGGHLIFQNRLIKPNETFYAHEKDIPKAFKDSIICVDDVVRQKVVKEQANQVQKTQEVKYKVKVTKDPEQFNVVNENGKAINDKPLIKDLAEELKASLES